MRRLSALAVLLLCACQQQAPISNNPVHDIVSVQPPTPVTTTIVQGLLDASGNLDQAVAVGALDANDAAPACLHAALRDLGIEVPAGTPPPASFTPKVSDLISAGSVLYIRARQAEKLSHSGIKVDPSCKQVIGQFILDAAANGKNLLPGGSLLPSIQ